MNNYLVLRRGSKNPKPKKDPEPKFKPEPCWCEEGRFSFTPRIHRTVIQCKLCGNRWIFKSVPSPEFPDRGYWALRLLPWPRKCKTCL